MRGRRIQVVDTFFLPVPQSHQAGFRPDDLLILKHLSCTNPICSSCLPAPWQRGWSKGAATVTTFQPLPHHLSPELPYHGIPHTAVILRLALHVFSVSPYQITMILLDVENSKESRRERYGVGQVLRRPARHLPHSSPEDLPSFRWCRSIHTRLLILRAPVVGGLLLLFRPCRG